MPKPIIRKVPDEQAFESMVDFVHGMGQDAYEVLLNDKRIYGPQTESWCKTFIQGFDAAQPQLTLEDAVARYKKNLAGGMLPYDHAFNRAKGMDKPRSECEREGVWAVLDTFVNAYREINS